MRRCARTPATIAPLSAGMALDMYVVILMVTKSALASGVAAVLTLGLLLSL